MKNTKKIISKILIYFALILGVLFCLVPLYWMIRSSLMNTVEVFMMPPRWIPSKFMWENYQEVFDTLPFGKYFLNSFIVTGGCVVGTMLTSSICAYGLARIKWRGRNVVFACIISSMMLPVAVTLIPTFLMWRTIGITDSFIPLIVPAIASPVTFFYMKQYMESALPLSLIEAARIDGSGEFRTFNSIVLPLMKPAIAVQAIFSFVSSWNNYFTPALILHDDKKKTLPILIAQLRAADWLKFDMGQVYVMIGLVCLALMLQFGLASRKMAHDRLFAVKLETSGNFSQIRNFIKQPYFFVLLLCIFLGAAAQNGVLVWTVRYVSGTLKSEALAPLCLSLFWIASTVSRVMTPRLPVRPSAVLAAGSALTAAVWTAGIVSENAVMMLICCIIGGLGSGCCIPVLLSEGAAFSPENTGLITSILMIVKTIGQILMPLAVSAIRASIGETAGMLLIAAAFLADAVAVAGLIYVKKKEK